MEKYNLKMRIMHWSMAIVIMNMLILGFYMVNTPSQNSIKWVCYGVHKSFGIVVFFMLLIRLWFRFSSAVPLMPKTISYKDQKAARYLVFFLYLLMFLMPLSGYLASAFGGYGIKLFGYQLPTLFEFKDHNLSTIAISIHSYMAYFMALSVSLHIIAPFKHFIVDKINIFKRII